MIETTRKKRILCLFGKSEKYRPWLKALGGKGYFVYEHFDLLSAMGQIYNEPPDMILLSTDMEGFEIFLTQMKNDPVYGHLLLMLIVERKSYINNLASLCFLPMDDIIFDDALIDEVLLRITIKELHCNRYLDANPLTRLPGNYSIMTIIQNSIDEKKGFALGYLDIDNFKAFNDRYGFARGDDMIRMTARILTNVIRRLSPSGGFVGHIGGDDFVFITNADQVEEGCRQIIQNFDLVSSTLEDDEDRLRGFIETEDRQGKLVKFPLPTISISVINSRITKLTHPGEASAIASEIKKIVKKLPGSNYMIDRREKSKYPSL